MAIKRIVVSALIIIASLVIALPMTGNRIQATAAETCQQILTRAMKAVQTSCENVGRNKACYGNNQVQAEAFGSIPLKFDAVGDRASIQNIRTLVTSPLDPQAGTWGLSLLKLQANLPDSLPGQNITFLVYGDTAIENASGDMKAFYFTSGLSNLNCKEAPQDGILVRSPQHTEVTFTANGVQITIASTILLTAQRNQAMSVGLIEGRARVVTSAGAQTLRPGEVTTIPLGGANGLTAAGAPSTPTTMAGSPAIAPVLSAADRVADKSAPINVSIDGCITAIKGNSLTIEDYQIEIGSNPVLKSARVGDCLRIDGTLRLDNGAVSFVLVRAVMHPKPAINSSSPANVDDKRADKDDEEAKGGKKPKKDKEAKDDKKPENGNPVGNEGHGNQGQRPDNTGQGGPPVNVPAQPPNNSNAGSSGPGDRGSMGDD